MSTKIDVRDLIKNSVHFGHQTQRANPKMRPYIWGTQEGIHLIDVSKTAYQMEKAAKFLENVAASSQSIMLVGTKNAAKDIIFSIGHRLGLPFASHRWVGGTFTNPIQVKKSVTKLLHTEDVVKKSDQHIYTKKEYGVFQKNIERLNKNVGGLRALTWPVGAVVVVDVKKEHVAVKEAQRAGIPIVALVDTNGNPSDIDYVIPANDDVPRSISIVMNYLADAIERGKVIAAATTAQQEEKAGTDMGENLVEVLAVDEESDEEKPKRRVPAPRRRTNSARP
jgi:small subunit ribosomal protein S2